MAVAKETILAAKKISPKPEPGANEMGEKTVIPKTRQKKTVEPITQNLTKKKDVQTEEKVSSKTKPKEELEHDAIQIREKLKAQIKQSEMTDFFVTETKTKKTSSAKASDRETSGKKNEGGGKMTKTTKAEKVAEKKTAREKAAAEKQRMKAEVAASKRGAKAEKKAKEKVEQTEQKAKEKAEAEKAARLKLIEMVEARKKQETELAAKEKAEKEAKE